jgi:hypothetical protein
MESATDSIPFLFFKNCSTKKASRHEFALLLHKIESTFTFSNYNFPVIAFCIGQEATCANS